MSIRKIFEHVSVFLILAIAVFLITVLFMQVMAWTFGGFFARHTHEYGEIFLNSIVYLAYVYICFYFINRRKSWWAKTLIIFSAIVLYFMAINVYVAVNYYFKHHSLKISFITKPNYGDHATYLTCENLKTKQIARIKIQEDYSADFPAAQKYTYIDVDGKSYPAVVSVDSVVDFMANVDRNTSKGIIFNYQDHTCLMATYGEKDTPSIEGFFSWEIEKNSDDSMRKIYAEAYNKKHEHGVSPSIEMKNLQNNISQSLTSAIRNPDGKSKSHE